MIVTKLGALIAAPALAAGMLIPLAGTASATTTYSGTGTEDAGVTLDAVADDLGLSLCAGKNPINAVDSLTAFEVTLSQAQMNGTAECGKTITITVNGKSAQATIVDNCAGCASASLDMSASVFNHFGGPASGKMPVTWSFN